MYFFYVCFSFFLPGWRGYVAMGNDDWFAVESLYIFSIHLQRFMCNI